MWPCIVTVNVDRFQTLVRLLVPNSSSKLLDNFNMTPLFIAQPYSRKSKRITPCHSQNGHHIFLCWSWPLEQFEPWTTFRELNFLSRIINIRLHFTSCHRVDKMCFLWLQTISSCQNTLALFYHSNRGSNTFTFWYPNFSTMFYNSSKDFAKHSTATQMQIQKYLKLLTEEAGI